MSFERINMEGGKQDSGRDASEREKKLNPLENVSIDHLKGMLKSIKDKNDDYGNNINPLNFAEELNEGEAPYRIGDILEDSNKIKELKKKFNNGENDEGLKIAQLEKLRLLAESFELSLPILIENFDFFGEGVESWLTTEYDDVMNGVDVVVDFPGNKSTLGLAVDLTISRESIARKLEKTRNKITDGILSSIKYYKTKDNSYLGMKKNIVPLVISASPETALRVTENIYFSRDKDDVFNMQSLEEAILQLEYFLEFSLKRSKKSKKVSQYIESDLLRMRGIWDEKVQGMENGELEKIRSKYDSNFEETKKQVISIFDTREQWVDRN